MWTVRTVCESGEYWSLLPSLANQIQLSYPNALDAAVQGPVYPADWLPSESVSPPMGHTTKGEIKGGKADYLDVTTSIETIQLGDDLKHCALHLVVGTRTIVATRTCDGEGMSGRLNCTAPPHLQLHPPRQ